MEVLKDLEELESILRKLHAQGQRLSKKENRELAGEMRKDLEASNEMSIFKTIAEVAKVALPLLAPIIALI